MQPPTDNIELADEATTASFAAAVARQARPGDLIALQGELGSGKTVFARAFIRALAGAEEVPSPTFTLVQTYETPLGAIWHFDAYRLTRPEEAIELGIEEALSDGIALVEWPEQVASLLPEGRLEIRLAAGTTPEARAAELRIPPGWADRIAPVLAEMRRQSPRASRGDEIASFLAGARWGNAVRRPLAGDASFRRYERLTRGGETAVLMDAPPPHEDVRPFLAVAAILHSLGLSAPLVLAQDVPAGLLLLEDLGDGTYTRYLAGDGDEAALYALAVDTLIALQRRFDPAASALLEYDEERLLGEAALLVDWYLPAMTGNATSDALRRSYLEAWRATLPVAGGARRTLVLRDYHVDNLIHLPERPGVAACGLLDFQDAVLGPASYDLVSLLEDARRDVPPALAEQMMERYLAAFPEIDRDAFLASYAVLGAQRNCKIIGIFTRLWRRDGKPQYLPHLPRVWRLLERDLAHPALAPVAAWLDRHVPPTQRGIPRSQDAA